MGIEPPLASELERRLLVIASKCCLEANRFDWYDSHFLRRFESAKRFLRFAAPDRVEEFEAAFGALRTRPDFQAQSVDPVFDPATFDEILETVHSLPYVALEHYESGSFGRSLLRNHPLFTRLQSTLTSMVSERVGEPVSPSYNFLSLYRGVGKCDPHLDDPLAKWTLDICLEQNVEWPIFVSQVVDWPATLPEAAPTIETLRADPAFRFDSIILSPNRGVIFSGSSQWHFREKISGSRSSFCHLLFLHYLPAGAESLADPKKWAAHFDIPELDLLFAAEALVMRKPDQTEADDRTPESLPSRHTRGWD